MYRLPDEDLDVVVLANVGFANLDKVANRLAKAALNPLPTPRPSAGPHREAMTIRFAGMKLPRSGGRRP